MAARSKVLRKLLVVVDLPVVGEPDVAVLASHRLVCGGREIEDRQAAVTKHNRREDKHSSAVRATMSHLVGHPSNQLLGGREPGAEIEGSGYATHGASILMRTLNPRLEASVDSHRRRLSLHQPIPLPLTCD
jgi:hypothetical protein